MEVRIHVIQYCHHSCYVQHLTKTQIQIPILEILVIPGKIGNIVMQSGRNQLVVSQRAMLYPESK